MQIADAARSSSTVWTRSLRVALGGEEGDHIGGAGGQAGQGVLVTPGASGGRRSI
jgi:hypothetical protein